MSKEGANLKQLGSNKTKYLYNNPNKSILETFKNKEKKSDYIITLQTSEFTSLCPKTGQPDFAEIKIYYIPNKKCIETKSFKLYLFSFRNYGSFMESITNKIINDLVEICKPKWMKINTNFKIRGGIKLNVEVEYNEKS